jgi:hypothetical protein
MLRAILEFILHIEYMQSKQGMNSFSTVGKADDVLFREGEQRLKMHVLSDGLSLYLLTRIVLIICGT